MTNYQSMFLFCKMWWRLWQRYCEGPHNDEPLKIDGGSEHLPKRRQLQGNISIFSRTRCYSTPGTKCIKVFTGEPQAVRAAGAGPGCDLRTNESERCQPCSVRQPGASCSFCRNQVELEWKRSCIRTTWRWEYDLVAAAYSINIHPHPRYLGQALADFVEKVESFCWLQPWSAIVLD